MGSLFYVNDREEGVVDSRLTTGLLKPRSGFEPEPRCEPSNFQLISRRRSRWSIKTGINPIGGGRGGGRGEGAV